MRPRRDYGRGGGSARRDAPRTRRAGRRARSGRWRPVATSAARARAARGSRRPGGLAGAADRLILVSEARSSSRRLLDRWPPRVSRPLGGVSDRARPRGGLPPPHRQGTPGLSGDRCQRLSSRRSVRQRIRDRSAILFALVAPLGLATAFSLLIPRGAAFHTGFVVHDGDGGSIATALVEHLTGPIAEAGFADVAAVDIETLPWTPSTTAARSVAILIPEGFTEAVMSGQPTTIRLVGLFWRPPSAARSPRAVVGGSSPPSRGNPAGHRDGRRLEPGSAAPGGRPRGGRGRGGAPGPDRNDGYAARPSPGGHTTFYAAAMAIMFVFFITIHGPLAYSANGGPARCPGCSQRRSAPVRSSSERRSCLASSALCR